MSHNFAPNSAGNQSKIGRFLAPKKAPRLWTGRVGFQRPDPSLVLPWTYPVNQIYQTIVHFHGIYRQDFRFLKLDKNEQSYPNQAPTGELLGVPGHDLGTTWACPFGHIGRKFLNFRGGYRQKLRFLKSGEKQPSQPNWVPTGHPRVCPGTSWACPVGQLSQKLYNIHP